ncbi:hypothetical protein PIB30_013866 [Stylosanthes scabra]|uniref:SMAX1-like nucleotide binding domain-containing protein n=1 Tax=Stylosanthes scabra TaxID=79078 RepID=A0ABU6U6G2_9FABA|nr:hypothetical protein [Stylosanthes scabra]
MFCTWKSTAPTTCVVLVSRLMSPSRAASCLSPTAAGCRAHDPTRVRPPRLLPHHLRVVKRSTGPRWGGIAINPIPVPDGAGKLHPFVGRKEQLDGVIKIICRVMKNNPWLVGEAGVGKTAIIEGLAHRILTGSVPQKLKGKKVIKLDVSNFLYGVTQSEGGTEDMIKSIIKEVEQSGDVLLFVKGVQNMFETSSSLAQNFEYHLVHALERGFIQVEYFIIHISNLLDHFRN